MDRLNAGFLNSVMKTAGAKNAGDLRDTRVFALAVALIAFYIISLLATLITLADVVTLLHAAAAHRCA